MDANTALTLKGIRDNLFRSHGSREHEKTQVALNHHVPKKEFRENFILTEQREARNQDTRHMGGKTWSAGYSKAGKSPLWGSDAV